MSKLHQPHGRADVDTRKGELRKPDDYSDQPEQHPGERFGTQSEPVDEPGAGRIGDEPREYGHSSGDRNSKRDERDWPALGGGSQRTATPAAPDSKDIPPRKNR